MSLCRPHAALPSYEIFTRRNSDCHDVGQRSVTNWVCGVSVDHVPLECGRELLLHRAAAAADSGFEDRARIGLARCPSVRPSERASERTGLSRSPTAHTNNGGGDRQLLSFCAYARAAARGVGRLASSLAFFAAGRSANQPLDGLLGTSKRATDGGKGKSF